MNNRSIRQILFALFFALPGVMFVAAAHSQETAKTVDCLRIESITDTEILDNSNIVFQTGPDNYYLNSLPYACQGLKFEDAYMYRTSLDRVCDVDVITVLQPMGGGYQSGLSCGLGRFKEISKNEVAALRDKIRQDR